MINRMGVGLAVLLLSGCVYYVPYEVVATEPGEDQTVVYEDPAVVYDSYVVSPFYPWGSVDYFYFGNNYYRPVPSSFISFGFYTGIGWYPPYYSPYYYSAWYAPFYSFPFPYYGAGYGWGYGYSYWGHHDSHHDDDHWGDHDGGHDGNWGGGHGGQGGGHPVRGPGGSGNYGTRVDGSPRTGGRSSLDRHVQVPREAGRFDRNVPATPSADGRDQGMVVISRGDNKMQPNRVQPAGNQDYQGRSRPVAPVDRSGIAVPKGQVRSMQPGQNHTAPARTGAPAGSNRPIPTENSSGNQFMVRQAPSQPGRPPQSAPGPSQSVPSLNRQLAPPPVSSVPPAESSQRPDGDYERGPRRSDNDGGWYQRDSDDR